MASGNKRPIVVKKGLDLWVMTYGDMMSLLLTFFVLIVSFSSIQDVEFKKAALGLQQAFGVMVDPQTVLELNDPLVPEMARAAPEQLVEDARELERSLLAEGREDAVAVDIDATGVTIRIAAPVLFASGEARLPADGASLLEPVAALIRKHACPVQVRGHTDTVPISTGRFPSNWYLSAARAVAVAECLANLGVAPERLGATGFGEYRPLADNATAEGRLRNRRVEIFLEFAPERDGSGLPLVELEDDRDAVRVEPTLRSPVTERLGRLRDGGRDE